jgi:hypothetical protein
MQTTSQLWSSITLTLHEIVVSKKLMQIKGHMLTILSNVVSTLVLMAQLHPHIDISRMVNENILKGIFQLEGMVIDEHQALKKALQDLLDIKKFHIKTWSCQQLRSMTIDMQSYEGMAFYLHVDMKFSYIMMATMSFFLPSNIVSVINILSKVRFTSPFVFIPRKTW